MKRTLCYIRCLYRKTPWPVQHHWDRIIVLLWSKMFPFSYAHSYKARLLQVVMWLFLFLATLSRDTAGKTCYFSIFRFVICFFDKYIFTWKQIHFLLFLITWLVNRLFFNKSFPLFLWGYNKYLWPLLGYHRAVYKNICGFVHFWGLHYRPNQWKYKEGGKGNVVWISRGLMPHWG